MSADAFLVILSLLLAPFSVVSTALLIHEAWKKPRIGALTERAVIGADILVMIVSGVAITINRLTGYDFFPVEFARLLFLGSLVVLEFVPLYWFALFATHRLGGIPREVDE